MRCAANDFRVPVLVTIERHGKVTSLIELEFETPLAPCDTIVKVTRSLVGCLATAYRLGPPSHDGSGTNGLGDRQ
jgi:hypothetical protein